ncbi:TniQ family protein [Devosia submarina]|uniref:TniQ family protein n=1 Tax=Devosia submarina TaxID=1173082 RepID=UPI001300B65A|nr:TniQ family protein [Devosia submarina]
MHVSPLSITLDLGREETGTSFACRLSSLWNVAPGQFWDDVGVGFRKIVAGDATTLATLAEIAGADAIQLVRNSPVRLHRSMLLVRGEQVTPFEYPRGRYRLCPLCAKEDIAANADLRPDQAVHDRVWWHSLPLRTCPIHRHPLVEVRTDLPEGFGYHDFSFRVGEFFHDLDALASVSDLRDPSPYEVYYMERLEGRAPMLPFLSDLKLYQAGSACEIFGRLALYGPKRRYASFNDGELADARDAGLAVLTKGEDGIGELFERLLCEGDQRLTRSHTAAGSLGTALTWLHSVSEQEELNALRKVVATKIYATFPTSGHECYFDVPNSAPRLHTVHDIERRFGVDWVTAGRVGKLAGVIRPVRAGPRPGPMVIMADDAERLFGDFVDVVSIIALARELGATQEQILALVDAGFLKPAFEDRKLLMSFRRPEVDAFIDRISKGAEQVPLRGKEMVSLRRAGWRSAPHMLELVRAVLEGKLSWLGRLSGERLFQGLLLLRSEAYGLFGKSTTGKLFRSAHENGPSGVVLSSTLTQTELCKRWQVKSEAVVELLDSDELVAPSRGSKGVNYFIDPLSVAQFEARYISLGMLARQRGEDRRRTSAVVRKAGVDKAFPELRGCFFPKVHLQDAGLL